VTVKQLNERLDQLEQLSAEMPARELAVANAAAAAVRQFDQETNDLVAARHAARHELVKAQHAAGSRLRYAQLAAEDLQTLKALIAPPAPVIGFEESEALANAAASVTSDAVVPEPSSEASSVNSDAGGSVTFIETNVDGFDKLGL
jgi:hypothetical protein